MKLKLQRCNSCLSIMKRALGLALFVLAADMVTVHAVAEDDATDTIPPPKHVVIILADTLRADYVGAYGTNKALTPALDKLAAEGVLFENAFTSAPISAPAYASLWSGQFPHEHGLTNNAMHFDPKLNLLPTFMKNNGFYNASFVANYYCGSKFGFGDGWDTMVDVDKTGLFSWTMNKQVIPWLDAWDPASTPLFLFIAYMDPHIPYAPPYAPAWLEVSLDGQVVGVPRNPEFEPVQRIPLLVPPGKHTVKFDRVLLPLHPYWRPKYKLSPYTWEGILNAGIQIEFPESLGKPDINQRTKSLTWTTDQFPIVANLVNPKSHPIEGYLSVRFWRSYSLEEAVYLYPRCVEFLDYGVNQVIESLRNKGVLDETLILFLSDHGEGLGDHDLVGHVEQLYDSLLHVPLIMRYPPLGKGKRISGLVSIIDLMPTIRNLFTAEADAQVSGQTLLPMVLGSTQASRPWILGETFPPEARQHMTCLRSEYSKLILNHSKKSAEFYQYPSDTAETNNLHSEEYAPAKEVEEFYKKLFGLSELFAPLSQTKHLNLDDISPEQLNELETLGYL